MSDELLPCPICGELPRDCEYAIRCFNCHFHTISKQEWNNHAKYAHELCQRIKAIQSAIIEATTEMGHYVFPHENTEADELLITVWNILEKAVKIHDVIADVEGVDNER